jgi:purine nucleosidase
MGRLHLVALGPLTNVALACQLDPSLPSRLASFTVMGAAEAVGNITPSKSRDCRGLHGAC